MIGSNGEDEWVKYEGKDKRSNFVKHRGVEAN